MTNQNVVVHPDAMALTVPPSATSAGGAGSSPLGRCSRSAWTAPKRRFPHPKPLEISSASAGAILSALSVGAMDVSSWVEAMKASSPTARGGLAVKDHMESWMAKYPSALAAFEQIGREARGKKVVVFLDYDGTLSPIVNDPDKAYMSPLMRNAVRDVARCFPTAIVSGRCIDKLYSFVQLSELYYAGSHGMDIKGPATVAPARTDADVHKLQPHQVLFQPAAKFVPMIEDLYNVLKDKTKSIPGALVETNTFCLSVHFRCVDEKRWGGLEELVRTTVQSYPGLRLTRGRKVLEVRPCIEWDKGRALDFLLGALGMDNQQDVDSDVLPIYIGDDRTDEDAFRVLYQRGAGIGILVSKVPRETGASYSLRDPTEVMEFLNRLVDWNRNQQQQQAICSWLSKV